MVNTQKDVIFISDKEIKENKAIVDTAPFVYKITMNGIIYRIISAESTGYYCVPLKNV